MPLASTSRGARRKFPFFTLCVGLEPGPTRPAAQRLRGFIRRGHLFIGPAGQTAAPAHQRPIVEDTFTFPTAGAPSQPRMPQPEQPRAARPRGAYRAILPYHGSLRGKLMVADTTPRSRAYVGLDNALAWDGPRSEQSARSHRRRSPSQQTRLACAGLVRPFSGSHSNVHLFRLLRTAIGRSLAAAALRGSRAFCRYRKALTTREQAPTPGYGRAP